MPATGTITVSQYKTKGNFIIYNMILIIKCMINQHDQVPKAPFKSEKHPNLWPIGLDHGLSDWILCKTEINVLATKFIGQTGPICFSCTNIVQKLQFLLCLTQGNFWAKKQG